MNLVSLALVECGHFSTLAAAAATFLVLGTVSLPALLSRKRPRTLPAPQDESNQEFFYVMAIIAGVSLFNACFPTYYLRGGRDYGLYLVQMGQMAHSGGINMNLAAGAEVLAKYGAHIVLELPGVYGLERFGQPGKLVVQFLHMFAAYGAGLFQSLGVEGGVRTNIVFGFFGLWGLFLVARTLLSFRLAVLALVFFAINPAFTYAQRLPLTELLTLMLSFAALLAFSIAVHRPGVGWWIFSAFILAANQFNRLDGFTSSFIILGYSLATVFFFPQKRLGMALAGLTYMAVTALGVWSAYHFSYPYFHDHWGQGYRELLYLCSAIAVGSVFINLIPQRLLKFLHIDSRLLGLAAKAMVVVCALWFVKSYFFYDRDEWEGSIHSRGVKELGFYITAPGLVLFLLGVWQLAKHNLRGAFPLLLVTCACTVIFTYNPAISQDHFWASRRWVGLIIPGITVIAVCGLAWVVQWLPFRRLSHRRLAFGFLVAGFCFVSLRSYAKFVMTPVLKDLHPAYSAVAADFHKQTTIKYFLTRTREIAAILTYVYQVPTFLIEYGDATGNFQDGGGFAGEYFVGMNPFHIQAQPLSIRHVCAPTFDNTHRRLPRHLAPYCIDLSYGKFPDADSARFWHLDLPFDNPYIECSPATACYHDQTRQALKVDASDAAVDVEVAYTFLNSGRYAVGVSGKADQPAVKVGVGIYDLRTKTFIRELTLTMGESVESQKVAFTFQQESARHDRVAVRLRVPPGTKVDLQRFYFQKLRDKDGTE